jgi:hypothetical protein
MLAAISTPARLANNHFHGEIIATTTRTLTDWILQANALRECRPSPGREREE